MAEKDDETEKERVKFAPELTERRLMFAADDRGTIQVDKRSYGSNLSDEYEEEDDESRAILDPDHPLLEKFQKALKDHLLRQVEHLKNEVFELETGAKKKNEAREQLGIETYEAQQLVNKQQQELELCVAELDHICSATEQMEFELQEANNSFAAKRLELLEAEKKELHLRVEMDGLNLLMHQMKQWEGEVESELVANQRIFEKSKKDKMKLAVEKRQLDTIIYNLMTETWRLEEELETMEMQIRVKEEEREKLAETVTVCSIDMERLNSNYRCILHSWDSVIVNISQRDKQYNAVTTELHALNEKLRCMAAELDQTKKLCEKEMMYNERLTDIKARIQTDLDNCTRLLDAERKKRDQAEAQMNTTQGIIDRIENDIKGVSADNINKDYEHSSLVKEFEKFSQQKVSLEEQIMKTLEEKLTNSKAAQYLNKMAYQIKDRNRDLEINLANLENANAKTLMDIEAQKCVNEETQRFLDELIRQQKVVENDLKNCTEELNRLLFSAGKKQREIDILTTRIEKAISKQGGLDVSPEELKILTLEKNIEEVQEKIISLKQFWLRQQGHVVKLSQQRQDQINDMDMLKKQMQLLVQKNLKINDELIAYSKLEEKLNRQINTLQARLIILSDSLNQKRGCVDSLGKNNDFMQYIYTGKLQDAEMEEIKIQSDITDIEEDKVNLSNDLVELNREALAWEKKIQMTLELKKNITEEQGSGGEVGNMKSEIHRMHVRLSQLKKAQDKLIHDLEHCISRRDAILTGTEAREKRETGASEKTRINFTRKLDDMKNKVKQIETEIETTEDKIEKAEQEEERLAEQISLTKQDTEMYKQKIEEMQQKVEAAKTDRQKNLEVLVLKQKKLKVYSELAKGRNPYIVYRTPSAISTEYDKQKTTNNKLLNILENLLSDFPNHYQRLSRIQNTLKLPLLYLYQV